MRVDVMNVMTPLLKSAQICWVYPLSLTLRQIHAVPGIGLQGSPEVTCDCTLVLG